MSQLRVTDSVYSFGRQPRVTASIHIFGSQPGRLVSQQLIYTTIICKGHIYSQTKKRDNPPT